jgi:Spy/CpxP family protein refolding chaperone
LRKFLKGVGVLKANKPLKNEAMKTTTILITSLMLLTSLTMYAQRGRGNRNAAFNNNYQTCINEIPDLTQDQIQKITALENAHKAEIDQLRNGRRSTRDGSMKTDIRQQMLNARDAHREQVKALLTPEQQKVYEALPGNNGRNRQAPAGRSNVNRTGRSGRNYRF